MKEEYKMDLCKRYEVVFAKDGAKHKAGDKVLVNMPLAFKFFKQGKIKATPELLAEAEKQGCKELFTKPGKA